MSDFWFYLKLGFTHVLDWQAYDHVLFLVVLCAAYTFSAWKKLLVLVSLFTLGHTISLLLAHYDAVSVSSEWIEFLIPITILTTAIYNLFMARKVNSKVKIAWLFLTTTFFGLIHGFGFASYYRMMNEGEELTPLLSFALGVELSQIVVVIFVLLAAFATQLLFRFNKRDWVLVVSSIVIGMVIPILIENWIF